MSGPAPAPAGFRTALWGIAVAVLGLGIALIATIQILQTERQAHQGTQATLQSLRDSLHAEARSPRGGGGGPGRIEGITTTEIAVLRAWGLADPVADLKADLARHPELIPIEPVLGGTMGFRDPERIWVLNARWVFADFEDGHIGGSMLLEYRVRSGRITWRRLAVVGD